MNDTDVLVVGAGPTGITLAASLIAHGLRAVVVDKLLAGANTSRAAAVNARTLEVLEDLDVTRRMVKAGLIAPRFTMREGSRPLISVDFSQPPTEHPYTLMISQADTERLLLERLNELGGDVIRPKTLSRIAQDADGVTATTTAKPSGRATSSGPTACTARCANRPASASPAANSPNPSRSPTFGWRARRPATK